MLKRIMFTLCALGMVMATYDPAPAVFKGGALRSDSAWTLEVTANSGPTAVTIFELGTDRVRRVSSFTVEYLVTERVDFPAPRNAVRFIVEVDIPDGTASARVKVTQEGAPLFPEETISASQNYVLDVR